MIEVNYLNISSYKGSWIIIYSNGKDFFEFVHILNCQNKESLNIGIQNELWKFINSQNPNVNGIKPNRLVDYYEYEDTECFFENRKMNKNNRQWFILSGSKQEINKIYFK